MKNINVTIKGLLHEEDFESMMIQLRAEYAKAVPNKQLIVEILEKTRNNRAIWNEEKLRRVLYDIVKRVPCLDTEKYISYHAFIRSENLYLTNKLYFWIMTD